MITSIRLINFKNFVDETLRVGPFTIIVGANASGKSNVRDAFRFLHGIGRGYTLAEIIGGKYGPGGQREWEPIRGATNEIVRQAPSSVGGESSFSLEVELNLNGTPLHYSITVGRFMEGDPDRNVPDELGPFRLLKEELRTESGTVYTTSSPGYYRGGRPPHSLSVKVEESSEPEFQAATDQPVLTQYVMPGRTRRILNDQLSGTLRSVLADMRFWDPLPERMREPSFPGATVLGDFGDNLPTALQEIRADAEQAEILTSWIQELTPMDVEDFEFPFDHSGRVHLTIREKNGKKISAYSASDGTLRFLAVLIALLGKNPVGMYFFEEIETGIHPARQWLLVELIEKQAAKRGIQVITTTHSPDMLTFVNDDTFEHLSVVCRLEDSHDAVIRPVARLPNAQDLQTSQGGLGRLLAENWMETALTFTEGNDKDDER
ncbi:MAG: AAA family ATPase [Nitrospira sp.]|nr:AAA family ATPase [Nitrospira sp.]MCY3955974.1 AAA family ATPase [Nitrospira sp.]MCY4132179.1 AAA family ATPase [Nitrospira sp.]